MNLPSQFRIENELKTMGSEQLKPVIRINGPQLFLFVVRGPSARIIGSDERKGRERSLILNDLRSLDDQIGDLAFNNYRTYADAGRTTQHCTEIRMDVCIRAGYYEAAYSLTNYGMVLQQHSIIKNALVKGIADKLVEARSFLLEELFNKFSGPLDLASSIQVVNNVRKVPNLTSTQLRICILQHRDMYLNRQILDITNHPEFAIRAIEIYRDCMYDTLVLYLAVFPENEPPRKDPSLDPRWETWPPSAPSVLLGQWTARNITRLLDLIRRTDMKSGVDICTIWSKLMSLAASLGRMGLDFRALVVDSLTKMVLERFRSSIRATTNVFLNDTKVLCVVNEEISSLSVDRDVPANGPPVPPPEISLWDDICIYGNGILDAINDLRYSPYPLLIESVVACIRDSLKSVLLWLPRNSSSPHFAKAVEIFCLYFGPFIGRCIRFVFPFSSITRLFGTSITPQTYESLTELNMTELVASCDGGERIQEVLRLHSSQNFLFEVEPSADLQREVSPKPNGNVGERNAAAECLDTCSSSEPTSIAVHFELCQDGAEEGAEDDSVEIKGESCAENVSFDDKGACFDDQLKLQLNDATITVDTDDVPALVDTAPSPLYNDAEAATIQEDGCGSEQQKLEDEYESKKD